MFEERPDRSAEVVFVGRSNVGKSTLLRAITGHDFATGSRPGVTRQPSHYDWRSEDFVITDMPGFGFMEGVPEARREAIKTGVVRYLETHAEEILVAVQVIDANSAVEIIDRHTGPDEVAHDVELFHFLLDLGIPTVVAANKMDKVDDRDHRLDQICERLGLVPPWQQHRETIAPISAKRGAITPVVEAVRHHLHERERDDLFKFF